jgi:hypothetical protein
LYPGTPEPDGFDCTHEGKAIVAKVTSAGTISHEVLRTGKYSFKHETMVFWTDKDIYSLLDERFGRGYEDTLVKLSLSGRLKPEDFRELGNAMEKLRQRMAYLTWDASSLREYITIEKILERYAKGTFPQRLLTELSMDEKDAIALERAYEILEGMQQ